jgi:DNA-binding XRE family transcriptional regulator
VTVGDDRMDGSMAEEGRPLRDVRAELLLSIRDLAQRAGVAPSTIFLIESGRSTPRLSVARRLAEALNVDPLTVREFRRAIQAAGGLR